MKIEEFEKNIAKYNVVKIDKFQELKKYLTNSKNYSHNFSPEEITEGYIDNDKYYRAYVFDEENIAKRPIQPLQDSGWKTTIIFISSCDNINMDRYFIHQSNGLTYEEMKSFLLSIHLLCMY